MSDKPEPWDDGCEPVRIAPAPAGGLDDALDAAWSERVAMLTEALAKERYRADAGWAMAQHWLNRYLVRVGEHEADVAYLTADRKDDAAISNWRTEERIHPLTRLDGLFFAAVSRDGRLVNVLCAHNLKDARVVAAIKYGEIAADELSIFPAHVSWVALP